MAAVYHKKQIANFGKRASRTLCSEGGQAEIINLKLSADQFFLPTSINLTKQTSCRPNPGARMTKKHTSRTKTRAQSNEINGSSICILIIGFRNI